MHAYLLMIDNKGDKKWARTYGISGQASAQCAIEICGGFLIGGYTSASEGVLRPLRNSCSYILRIDKKGNKVWEKTYPWIGPLAFGEPVGIKGIAPSGKGGFLAISGHDFLMKIDDEGNSIFEHYLGECPESIIALPDGTHMIAGSRDIQWGHGWDSWEDRDPYFLRFQEASETIPVFIITLALLALLLSRTK